MNNVRHKKQVSVVMESHFKQPLYPTAIDLVPCQNQGPHQEQSR